MQPAYVRSIGFRKCRHSTRCLLPRLSAVIALLITTASIAANDPLAAQRHEFVQALHAVQLEPPAAADSSELQNYILYPYLQAARLSPELQRVPRTGAALDQRIAKFLDTHGTAPATRELRHAWLQALALHAQWAEFLQYYRAADDDAELRCQHLNALLASQHTTEVASLVVPLWLSGERLVAVCNPPFQWAQANHIITPALIEQRIRLALKSGNYLLANDLIAPLPAAQAAPLKQWITLIEQPQAAIDALIAHPEIKVEVAALQDGWTRLARKAPDAAMRRLSPLSHARDWTELATSPYALNLALALAWNRRDEALEYFARVAPSDMTEQAYEWQARAALWRGDWSLVTKLIAALPANLKSQVRWRYWTARAAEQMNEVTAARGMYQQLVTSEDNAFAALAAARLNTPYAPHPQSLAGDATLVQKLSAQPEMIRLRELIAVQLNSQAMLEWNSLYQPLNSAEQLAAVILAHQWGWHDQAITYAAKLGQYNDYEFLYPQPYETEVNAAAKLSGLSVDFIYGQLRQESLYRTDAKSTAGAVGLMQLIPSSARATAKQLKLPRPSDDDLFNPAINVPLGAVNLKQMIAAFDGQTIVGLAAYNAGPNAVRRWLPDKPMDTDIWIENIPYNETRTYVLRVLWHSLIFHWQRVGQPLNTESWLALVQPAK